MAWRIFAWSTVGSLAGNYAAGFWLLAQFGTHAIIFGTSATFAILSLLCPVIDALVFWLSRKELPEILSRTTLAENRGRDAEESSKQHSDLRQSEHWPRAVLTVVCCSFVTGSLEGAAFRVLAPLVGVSLILSAGVVGVVLTGMALGNRYGGRLASSNDPVMLRKTLIASGASALMIGPLWKMLLAVNLFAELPLMIQTVCNRKFNQNVPEEHLVLTGEDYYNIINYILNLRTGKGYDTDEVHAYLKARIAGKKPARPKAKSWRS